MIDNQDQAQRLLRRLNEVLPLSALATPPLMAELRGRFSGAKITWDCKVTKVMYAGDEGGVMCQLTFDEEEKEEVVLVSITHKHLPRVQRATTLARHVPSEFYCSHFWTKCPEKVWGPWV